MRIIAGRLKGKKLKTPKGLITRPVLARVREALFNILGDLEGARILDLYSGTGSIGIEALSRGAESAVFVEKGLAQCRIIRENLNSIAKDAVVLHSDVERALRKLQKDRMVFDFAFADPPYEMGLSQKTVESVCKRGLLAENGVMAVTTRYSEEMPDQVCMYRMVFDRRYGDTRLAIFKFST